MWHLQIKIIITLLLVVYEMAIANLCTMRFHGITGKKVEVGE